MVEPNSDLGRVGPDDGADDLGPVAVVLGVELRVDRGVDRAVEREVLEGDVALDAAGADASAAVAQGAAVPRAVGSVGRADERSSPTRTTHMVV